MYLLQSKLFLKEIAAGGLTAKEWVSQVTELLGGKSGGKDTNAQATALTSQKLPNAIQLAEQYALMKIAA